MANHAAKKHAAIEAQPTPPAQIRLFYTPAEAAEALRIGKTFVFKLIKQGDLRSVKLGRHRLVVGESLQDLVSRAR